MGDCGFDKGFTHIGSLNHHMMPEHGKKARNVRTISLNRTPTPAPCVTRSAAKLTTNRGLPEPDSVEHGRSESPRPWDLLATRAKDARLAFEDTKEVLRAAINWCEALSADIQRARDRHAAGICKELIRGPTSKSRLTKRPPVVRPARKHRVSFHSDEVESLHPSSTYNHGAGHHREPIHGTHCNVVIRPQICFNGQGGLDSTDQKAAHELEKRKAISRAIADKLHRPPTVGSCASPEMVRKWVTYRKQNAKWDVADPIPTWHEVGQPSSPVCLSSGSLDGGANFQDASMNGLSPEWEPNKPIRYSKCDPESLLMNANESIKEVIELGDRTTKLVWDIDCKSPVRPPRGDSIRRPLLLPNSPIAPKHGPVSEINSGPSMHRTMDPDVGAVNLRWEPNGRSQSFLVRVPNMFCRGKAPYAFPSSPPSAARLVKELEDSAQAQIVGSGSKPSDSIGIEDLLAQVDNVASIGAIGPATHDSHNSKVKDAFPVPIDIPSPFCNLSTQSIQWIVDGLES